MAAHLAGLFTRIARTSTSGVSEKRRSLDKSDAERRGEGGWPQPVEDEDVRQECLTHVLKSGCPLTSSRIPLLPAAVAGGVGGGL